MRQNRMLMKNYTSGVTPLSAAWLKPGPESIRGPWVRMTNWRSWCISENFASSWRSPSLPRRHFIWAGHGPYSSLSRAGPFSTKSRHWGLRDYRYHYALAQYLYILKHAHRFSRYVLFNMHAGSLTF